MPLIIPVFSLLLLMGASGSGKSTFARRHFRPTEIVSSDACRAMICDDENNLQVTGSAFNLLHIIVQKRLACRKLTVIDATNVQEKDRRPLIHIALRQHVPVVAIVLDIPEAVCLQRTVVRMDRIIAPPVIQRHLLFLRRSMPGLHNEGFDLVHQLSSEQEVNDAVIERMERMPIPSQEARHSI